MDIYVNDINSIVKLLVSINEEKKLSNYLEQLNCATKSEFFNSSEFSQRVRDEYNLDTSEVKQKYLTKLNQSINECIETLNSIM